MSMGEAKVLSGWTTYIVMDQKRALLTVNTAVLELTIVDMAKMSQCPVAVVRTSELVFITLRRMHEMRAIATDDPGVCQSRVFAVQIQLNGSRSVWDEYSCAMVELAGVAPRPIRSLTDRHS